MNRRDFVQTLLALASGVGYKPCVVDYIKAGNDGFLYFGDRCLGCRSIVATLVSKRHGSLGNDYPGVLSGTYIDYVFTSKYGRFKNRTHVAHHDCIVGEDLVFQCHRAMCNNWSYLTV